MDDFDRVRQKIRDLQSRFLGAQGTGTDFSPLPPSSPESTPPQDFWKRHYEQEKRKWEEQLVQKESALSRRIQEIESRFASRPSADPGVRQDVERQIGELRQRLEALQAENIDLRGQATKAFQLHKTELENTSALTQQLEAEKKRRQEDARALQQGVDNARADLEKRAQRLELEKTELKGLIDDIKANNFSLAAEHKILKEENAILKENILHHNDTSAMREQLHFAAQEKMAEGLSRRLKNYLSLATGCIAQGMQTELIETQTQAEKALDAFMELSRPSEAIIEPLPANELMESVLRGLDEKAKVAQVSFAKDFGEVPAIAGDRRLLKEALQHIISNAIEASPAGSVIRLKTFRHPAGKVEIQVIDNGSGVPDKIQSKLFQPFFTTKKGHQGLGLCRAKRIVNAHHGWITVAGNAEGGTVIAVELPASKSQ